MATTIVDSKSHNGNSPNAAVPPGGAFNESMSGHSIEDIDIVGSALIENGVFMSNQRNGSYSNLYPDNDLSTRHRPGDPALLSTSVTGEGFYSNIPQIGQDHDSSQGFSVSARNSEDVSDRTSAISAQQQHVYSNITEEGEPVVMTNERISWEEGPSSPPPQLKNNLAVDDLDLDDLSTVATAFQGQEQLKKSSRRVSREKLEKIGSDSSISSASSRPTMMTSTPNKSTTSGAKTHNNNNKKHIIPIVAVIETSNNVNNLVNCPSKGAADELNATKLQMLHDTTMIDCALDLDSLDAVIDTVKGRNVL